MSYSALYVSACEIRWELLMISTRPVVHFASAYETHWELHCVCRWSVPGQLYVIMHNIMSRKHMICSGHSRLVWLWGPTKWYTLKRVFCQFQPSRLAYRLLRCLKVVIWWFSWQQQTADKTDSYTPSTCMWGNYYCGNITTIQTLPPPPPQIYTFILSLKSR